MNRISALKLLGPACFSMLAFAGVASSVASADASRVAVIVCNNGNECERVMVDKALANLYKISPMGSIVINSTVAENEDEAKSAMRECNTLKRKFETDASQPDTSYQCKLEPQDGTLR